MRNSAHAQTAKFEIEFENVVIQSERGGISASDNTQRPQAMGYLVYKIRVLKLHWTDGEVTNLLGR